MRELSRKEQNCVNGGIDEADDIFNGFVLGATAGFVAGATASVYYVSKHRLLVVIPGVLENAAALGAVAGAISGGLLGAFTGLLFSET